MKLKKIIAPILILLLLLSWYKGLTFSTDKQHKLNKYLEKAKKYEEKGIYIDALKSYKEALAYSGKPIEIQKDILNMYLKLGDFANYKKYSMEILEEYNYPTDVVFNLLDVYDKEDATQKSVSLLNLAISKNSDISLVEKRKEYLGAYRETYLYYDLVKKSLPGYYVYEDNSKKGLMNLAGEIVLQAQYTDVKGFDDTLEYATVFENGEWYVVQKQGYKKLVPDFKVDYLGVYGSNLIPYLIGDKYSYMNENMEVVKETYFDYAGNFRNGLAAVKTGDKWALIDKKLEPANKFLYEDIVLDDNDFAISNGRYIAKTEGKYQIYDLKGNVLSDSYDYIRAFVSNEATAFKDGDKWGFIDKDGNVLIKATYEDAYGFSDGLAPVLIDGYWGYVDTENILRVENKFSFASTLSENKALVQDDKYKFLDFIR